MTFALRWIVAAFFGIFGGWVIACNYACVVIALGWRRRSSLIPLLGGLALSVGMIACPTASVARLAWVPFLVDPGGLLTLVMFVYTAIITRGFRR